jgi:TRAP-type C4-dicarboxylate transport system substrate-binding protein
MKRIPFSTILVVFAVTVLLTPLANAGPIEIQYVTFVDSNHLTVKLYKEIWKEIEEKSQGKIKFTYRGGPEAIKIFAQAMAVYNGATDMVLTTPSFMGKLVKGTDMLTLCKTPVSEHRKTGLYDYMNEVYNKRRMQFLQMYPRETGTAYVLLSKEKIDSIDDFKGKSVRGGDFMDAIAPVFGMSTVSMKHFEEYSALERGVIDIGRMTIESMVKFRLFEVAKYLVKPAYASAPMSWFMNLNKWNQIPKDLQDMILDTMYGRADEIQAKTQTEIDKMYENMAAEGVQIVELKGKDKQVYTEKVEKAMYDYYLKEEPEVAKKIYELSHK